MVGASLVTEILFLTSRSRPIANSPKTACFNKRRSLFRPALIAFKLIGGDSRTGAEADFDLAGRDRFGRAAKKNAAHVIPRIRALAEWGVENDGVGIGLQHFTEDLVAGCQPDFVKFGRARDSFERGKLFGQRQGIEPKGALARQRKTDGTKVCVFWN